MRRTGDDNDPILKEIEPIVHSIWAEGISRGIHRKTCLWMYTLQLVLEPLGVLLLIGKRIIPIILLTGIYFYFSDLNSIKRLHGHWLNQLREHNHEYLSHHEFHSHFQIYTFHL